HEGHRGGDARMDLGDRAVHLAGDRPVRRMALAAGAELDQVKRLPGVELEHVADAESEAERVRRLLDEAFGAQARVLRARDVEGPLELAGEARGRELVRDVGAEIGRQPLPLAREQAVALQVAEGAIVGDDLEAVAESLEAAARSVAAVLARPEARAQEVGPRAGTEGRNRSQRR